MWSLTRTPAGRPAGTPAIAVDPRKPNQRYRGSKRLNEPYWGYITIVDRAKDLINTGGTLVASREVEDVLFTHPAVAEVAVIATPDPKWIEAVTAIVVLREGAGNELGEQVEQDLIAHARESLAPFKVPKRVFVVESLPKNTAGKLLKHELRVRYAGTSAAALRPE